MTRYALVLAASLSFSATVHADSTPALAVRSTFAPVRTKVTPRQWVKNVGKKVSSFLFAPRARGGLQEAMVLAAELHKDQTRKGTTTPYIAHLMGVASITLEHGGTEQEAMAALLHDAVEDQGGEKTRMVIERRFGPHVAHLVSGLTDSAVEPKPPWRARKEAYLQHLVKSDNSVRLISMSDKLYNARAIVRDLEADGPKSFSKFSGGRDGVLWYYRSLVETYNRTSSKGTPLLEELTQAVDQMHALAGNAPGGA
ncbi:MAG: HD domain-containing protein [Polyangia bacterium]